MRGVFKFLVRALARGAKLLALLGLVAGAAALAFALGLWQSLERDFRAATVSVPDLLGLSVDEASAKLELSSLALHVEARRPHEGTEPGRIFFQEPLPGSKTRRGRQVGVVLSSGSAVGVVPDLAGLSPRKAAVTLGEAKLRLGDMAQVHSDNAEANAILAQDPPAGALPVGSVVNVVVSLGPNPRAYVMPDLRGFSRARVEPFLATGGIRIGEVREQAVSDLAAGLISSQFPPPGSRVTSETAVSLVVARSVEAVLPGTKPPAPLPRVE